MSILTVEELQNVVLQALVPTKSILESLILFSAEQGKKIELVVAKQLVKWLGTDTVVSDMELKTMIVEALKNFTGDVKFAESVNEMEELGTNVIEATVCVWSQQPIITAENAGFVLHMIELMKNLLWEQFDWTEELNEFMNHFFGANELYKFFTSSDSIKIIMEFMKKVLNVIDPKYHNVSMGASFCGLIELYPKFAAYFLTSLENFCKLSNSILGAISEMLISTASEDFFDDDVLSKIDEWNQKSLYPLLLTSLDDLDLSATCKVVGDMAFLHLFDELWGLLISLIEKFEFKTEKEILSLLYTFESFLFATAGEITKTSKMKIFETIVSLSNNATEVTIRKTLNLFLLILNYNDDFDLFNLLVQYVTNTMEIMEDMEEDNTAMTLNMCVERFINCEFEYSLAETVRMINEDPTVCKQQ
ncbi:hypothetical protein PCE1_003174 [Barthelona sp. PCE]